MKTAKGIEEKIIEFFRPGKNFLSECLKAVTGNNTLKRDIFKRLVNSNRLIKSGKGIKNDPATYQSVELPAITRALAEQLGEVA